MWIAELIEKRKIRKLEITFNPHVFVREGDRNFNIDNIVETIRSGNAVIKKSEQPNKLCFKRYFGKENQTYFVILIAHQAYAEVITTWIKKGR